MEIMEMVDQIAELKNTILSLKAVAGAFSHSYTEGLPESNILSIQVDPDNYCYLFHVMTELIGEAKDKATALEAAADELFCKKE